MSALNNVSEINANLLSIVSIAWVAFSVRHDFPKFAIRRLIPLRQRPRRSRRSKRTE